jgi:Interferon-induced transmembrane protein/zinc-ribbon domain
MFCPQCGANNADNAISCSQCGRSFQPAAVVQPGVPPAQVPNYLVFAILVTVLCCLPAGIPAIVYAAQVNGKLQAGDIAGAQRASSNAKMWCWISVGLALFFTVVYALLIALGVMRHHY